MVKKFNIKKQRDKEVYVSSALGRLKNAPSPISCRVKILLQKNEVGSSVPTSFWHLLFILVCKV